MATYVDRKGRITATVSIKPEPRRSATFDSLDEAKIWAATTEHHLRHMRSVRRGDTPGPTLVTNLPPSKDGVMRLPRVAFPSEVSGIYFLFVEDRCVYVGKSMRLHLRVRDHIRTKQFDAYSWVAFPPEELDHWERHYINLMAPELNISGTFRAGENRRKIYTDRRELTI